MKDATSDDEQFNFIRRQTLKNAERYLTTYLSELRDRTQSAQETIENAQEQACQRAYEAFAHISTNCLRIASIL